jgi:hypothetical protein
LTISTLVISSGNVSNVVLVEESAEDDIRPSGFEEAPGWLCVKNIESRFDDGVCSSFGEARDGKGGDGAREIRWFGFEEEIEFWTFEGSSSPAWWGGEEEGGEISLEVPRVEREGNGGDIEGEEASSL